MSPHYLTRYIFGPAAVRALRITDTYSWHRVVYDQYDDVRNGAGQGPSGILWTVDELRGKFRITVLSDRQPHKTINSVAGVSVSSTELKEAFLDHDVYVFKTVVNPVKSVKQEVQNGSGRQRSRRCPVKGREEIKKWFLKLAESHGFFVSPQNLEIGQISVDKVGEKSGHDITLQKARISGICLVKDRELFKKAVLCGIGHGKAFGCGLLQVIPF